MNDGTDCRHVKCSTDICVSPLGYMRSPDQRSRFPYHNIQPGIADQLPAVTDVRKTIGLGNHGCSGDKVYPRNGNYPFYFIDTVSPSV